MIDRRFLIQSKAEYASAKAALKAHREICGPSCYNGDQTAEYIAEYEERKGVGAYASA